MIARSSKWLSIFSSLLGITVLVSGFLPEMALGKPADEQLSARDLERIWKLDRNGDSRISRTEFERWRGSKRRSTLFDQLDTMAMASCQRRKSTQRDQVSRKHLLA